MTTSKLAELSDARMLAETIIELHVLFDSNMKKVEAWLNYENLNFGGTSPMALIEMGRVKKVYQFVMSAEIESKLGGLG